MMYDRMIKQRYWSAGRNAVMDIAVATSHRIPLDAENKGNCWLRHIGCGPGPGSWPQPQGVENVQKMALQSEKYDLETWSGIRN